MSWFEEWFGEEYLELYAYRDEREAESHVSFFNERAKKPLGVVLDLACGGLRHLHELRRNGFQAVGCDLSFVLLESGRERVGRLPVVLGDMRSLPFSTAAFGGLVNFFTSFGYFETEKDDHEVIREMCRVLRPGSPFLFDFMNSARERANLMPVERRELECGPVEIERWFDVPSNTFNKRISIGEKVFTERVRAYDLPTLQQLFSSTGFTIEQVYGDFSGVPYQETSPRLIVIGSRTA